MSGNVRSVAPRRRGVTEAQLYAALEEARGFRSIAAKKLGITRQAIDARIAKSEKLKALVQGIDEAHLDLAENKLLAAIAAGQPWAIKYMLSCKGAARGYIPRQALNVHKGKDLDDVPTETLESIVSAKAPEA